MAPPGERAYRSFEQLSREQLEIYARELQEHFLEELRLRKEVEALNQRMAQQLRELTALNGLFQRHLAERFAVVDAYRQVLKEVQRLAQETSALAMRAESQLPPDLPNFPPPGPKNRGDSGA